ncbi:MAG: efflux RND transporter periplasmic adaptor subunit [Cellvibrionaceae bacterium]
MNKVVMGIAIVVVVAGVPLIQSMLDGSDEKVVELTKLQELTIKSSILASGTLTHEEEVRLTSEVIGRVTALHVEEGDRVTKGQLILQIDDEEPAAAVEQSEAAVRMDEIAIARHQLRVDNLENQFERKRELHARGLLDEDSFEASANELSIAKIDLASSRESLLQRKAQLEQAANRLKKTRVYAPITGVITSLDIKEGETAITSTTNIAGSSLMTIANPDSIQTEVYVDEGDVANVAEGQRAEVVAIAYPDTPIAGKVQSVAVSAKREEGKQGLSFSVKIKLKNDANIVLRPGMSCRAEIFTHGEQQVPALPIQAILVEEDRSKNQTTYYVFVNENGIAKRKDIKVGISDDTNQEVRDGLELGDEIVIGPDSVLRRLNDGDQISMAES